MIIKIEVQGLEALKGTSNLLQRGLRAFVKEGGQVIKKDILDHFDLNISPDGSPWGPLKPSTLKRKRSQKMLYRSGLLRANIAARSTGPLSQEVASWAGYSSALQNGTPNMVPRPFMGISDRAVSGVINILERRLKEISYGQTSVASVKIFGRND